MSHLPTIKAAELVKFLRGQGFVEERQSGNHLVLRHPKRNVVVTLPVRTGCDLGRGLTSRILKDAGIFTEYFMRRR